MKVLSYVFQTGTLVVSAYAGCSDITKVVTPDLKNLLSVFYIIL